MSKSFPTENTTINGKRDPWSVDRWGRLLAGATVLITTGLGLFVHPYWLAVTVFSSLNLVVTALTGSCALNKLLIRFGAREREDLFWPGGIPRLAENNYINSKIAAPRESVEAVSRKESDVRSSKPVFIKR